MKIAYFTDLFLPSVNGVVTSSITISDALVSSGHKVLICAPQPSSDKKISWGKNRAELFLLPSIPSFVYENFRVSLPITPGLINKVRAFNPDVIHFQTSFVIGGAGIVIGKMLHKPIVGTFHGYFMEPEYLKVVKLQKAERFLSNIGWKYTSCFFNRADAVVSPAKFSKDDLTKHGVDKPIKVISNTIDTRLTRKASKSTVSQLKRKHKLAEKVVLYVGRVSYEKCLDVLIRGFALAVRKEPDASLFIIGDGPARKSLVELSNKLGIGKHVVFAGEVRQEKLLKAGYYQVANLFATASTSECQPVSLMEAMYFGLPLVGVAKRGTGEMIKNVGLLSQPKDIHGLSKNILKVLQNRRLKVKLGSTARDAFGQKYSLAKVKLAYEKLYQSLV